LAFVFILLSCVFLSFSLFFCCFLYYDRVANAKATIEVHYPMSLYPKDAVHVIAQQHGIARLEDDVARKIAPDVEFRVRDLISEALKFMRAAKRKVLLPSDIAAALRLRNVEPLATPDFSLTERMDDPQQASRAGEFVRVTAAGDLYYPNDPVISLSSALTVRVPPVTRKITLAAHWLAVDGVQPAIPQNGSASSNLASSSSSASASASNASNAKGAPKGGASAPGSTAKTSSRKRDRSVVEREEKVVVRARVKDVLGQEHRSFYDRVTAALNQASSSTSTTMDGQSSTSSSLSPSSSAAASGSAPLDKSGAPALMNAPELKAALKAVATSQGLSPLLPYFVRYVVETVQLALSPLQESRLRTSLALVRSLCANETLAVELYLHQLLPALLTTLLSAQISSLELRAEAAQVVGYVARRYGGLYDALVGRIAATLVKAIKDPETAPGTMYGALCGLRELGPHAVYSLMLGSQSEIRIAEVAPRLRDHAEVFYALRDCVSAYVRHAYETKAGALQVSDEVADEIALHLGTAVLQM
jgi:transcription initiation factor TFIID subunit 6